MPTMDTSTMNKHTGRKNTFKISGIKSMLRFKGHCFSDATLSQYRDLLLTFAPITAFQHISLWRCNQKRQTEETALAANLCKVYKLRTLRSASGERYLPFSLSRSSCSGNSYRSLICQSMPTHINLKNLWLSATVPMNSTNVNARKWPHPSVSTDLDHCITHEVILKPLQLQLEHWRKINEKDSFLCILQQQIGNKVIQSLKAQSDNTQVKCQWHLITRSNNTEMKKN